ncbi:hypothetical protein SANTM175S_00957 [Streptomyces antimycoticus]
MQQASTAVPAGPGAVTTVRQPELLLADYHFDVPLDHKAPEAELIRLYAREVVAAEKSGAERERLPWLVYLQGGPGCGANRPVGRTAGWTARPTEYRVLLTRPARNRSLHPGQPPDPAAARPPRGTGRVSLPFRAPTRSSATVS